MPKFSRYDIRNKKEDRNKKLSEARDKKIKEIRNRRNKEKDTDAKR